MIGDGAGDPTFAALSDDVTMTNTGAVTVIRADSALISGTAYLADSATAIADGAVSATDKIATGAVALDDMAAASVDSTKIADGDLALDDLNWHPEWLSMDNVHGLGRALSDSISLYAHVMTPAGESWLLSDMVGDITANDQDTFAVSITIPYDCTIDSIEYAYASSGTDTIYNAALFGPDLSDGTNITDSSYQEYTGKIGSANWATFTTATLTITNDISATAGQRYAIRFLNQFDADNDSSRIAFVRLRVTR